MESMDVSKNRGSQTIIRHPYSSTSSRPTNFPTSVPYDDNIMQKNFKVAASNSASPESEQKSPQLPAAADPLDD